MEVIGVEEGEYSHAELRAGRVLFSALQPEPDAQSRSGIRGRFCRNDVEIFGLFAALLPFDIQCLRFVQQTLDLGARDGPGDVVPAGPIARVQGDRERKTMTAAPADLTIRDIVGRAMWAGSVVLIGRHR